MSHDLMNDVGIRLAHGPGKVMAVRVDRIDNVQRLTGVPSEKGCTQHVVSKCIVDGVLSVERESDGTFAVWLGIMHNRDAVCIQICQDEAELRRYFDGAFGVQLELV